LKITQSIAALAAALVLAAAIHSSFAADSGSPDYYFQTSLVTTHFDPKPDHNNHQGLLNVERRGGTGLVLGAAYFQNSFSQPSEYFYVGKLFTLPYTRETMYAKLTGGLLHGYRGEYQDEIPFNKYGVAPAILPSLGFQVNGVGGELVVFGLAGAMVTFGFSF
jgi:hypothetical protein